MQTMHDDIYDIKQPWDAGGKSGLTLELSQSKRSTFATDRFPLESLSAYLTSMMVLHFSLSRIKKPGIYS